MNFKEIQELIKLINKSNLTEFKVKDGDFELSLRTDKYEKQIKAKPQIIQPQQPVMPLPPIPPSYPAPAPAPPAASQSEAKSETGPEETETAQPDNANYVEIKSPMVGTFYRSSSPEKPAYVKVGDHIDVGQVVCIVEAMKLFNEIESEISGKIVKTLVEDAQPVEYDQVLFLVDPKG